LAAALEALVAISLRRFEFNALAPACPPLRPISAAASNTSCSRSLLKLEIPSPSQVKPGRRLLDPTRAFRFQPSSNESRLVGNPYLGIISGLPVNLDPIAESKSSFFAAPNRAAASSSLSV
jgi:hypothetical protein